MNNFFFAACLLFVTAGNIYAADIVIPAGTRIEGVTMFGTFAPAETATAQNFFLAIKASQNPSGPQGKEIPLKDCVILGDVVADISVNRAFFRSVRIVCSGARESNGTLLKGHAIDDKDNKLGIQGVPFVALEKNAQQRFVEVPPGAKITLITVEGVSITLK
jgi:hypothetical protein